MNFEYLQTAVDDALKKVITLASSTSSYVQLAVIFAVYLLAFWLAAKIRKSVMATAKVDTGSLHASGKITQKIASILHPLVAILILKIAIEVGKTTGHPVWLMTSALVLAGVFFLFSIIRVFVTNAFAASAAKWIGLPILFLHLVGYLPTVTSALKDISLNVGNISISAYGVLRVLIFGALLFWLGRESNNWGKEVIRKQKSLDVRTREVFTKLYEVGLFCVIALLLLNLMGINLTTLAVFGGAVGVGLGLGLQSIASNFISGIIILLDRSLTVGDFVELDDGPKGWVREFRMRYAVLETYDGKDILVPNEKFISSNLTNWTHKDTKQRYRVDFSVPYATDIRAMVEFIKVAVAEHPQVISGPEIPFEERPDCEIDSFGDSGVNMFVEFWMEGIDDGKNRVGGDLMLIIFETLRANGIEIPFPQREVKILNDNESGFKVGNS